MLRGLSLFGVFLMNFIAFAGEGVMATELQLLSLPTAGLDHAVEAVLDWLFKDKANTIFAFLFGLGFYLQMTRLEARGRDAESIYRRRLTVLLIIGIAHNFLLWNWDILHLYALAGFVLLAFRRAGNRTLVIAGLVLAAFGRTAVKALLDFTGVGVGRRRLFGFGGACAPGVVGAGRLPGPRASLLRHHDDQLCAVRISLGLAGVCTRPVLHRRVGRAARLDHARRASCERLAPADEVGAAVGSGAGGGGFPDAWQPLAAFRAPRLIAVCLHLLAVPVLAAGYVAAIMTGLQGGAARMLGWFAPAGRMALTNYLSQSFVIAFVLFGVGPGLALAGKIGTTTILGVVVVTYAAQILFSRWWLVRYAFGPAEWLWRAFTYGERPSMRSGG